MARAWGGDLRLPDPVAVRNAAIAALRAEAESILKESNRHVPVDSGDLRESGKVTVTSSGAVAVSYDTPYAVAQHEKWGNDHSGGQTAKFLENAFNKRRRSVLRGISSRMQRALRR